MRKRVLSLVGAAAAALALPLTVPGLGAPAPAGAATSAVTTVAYTFVPANPQLAQGDTLQYTNADTAPHTVTSTQVLPTGEPLFDSGLLTTGKAGPVAGTQNLKPGTYQFVCKIHPYMAGSLTVVATPQLPATPPAPSTGAVSAVSVGGTVPTPTAVTVHSGSVYATSYAQGAVYQLPILAGGVLGAGSVYASGFTNPLGLAFGDDGTLFVSDSHPSSTPGRQTDGRVQAVPPGGGAPQLVIDGLPNGRHNTNGLRLHAGRLYITNGSSTDDGISGGVPEQPLSGTLLSVPSGARNLKATDPAVAVAARGLRNIYDVDFRPGTDVAWMPMNGPDNLDPYGQDLLVSADVTKAAPDFGFPGCVYASGPGGATLVEQNPTPGVEACPAGAKKPDALMGLHVSADGAAFGPSDRFWHGDLFVAEFGNFYGTAPAGHKIVRVPIDASGHAGTPQDFLVAASPLGVAFGPDGLYVADFGSGQITLVKPIG